MKIIKFIIMINFLFNYSLCFGIDCPPLKVVLDGSIDRFLPYKDINLDNMQESKKNMDKRKEIIDSLTKEYIEMWKDFVNKGETLLPYCVVDAFKKLQNQDKEIKITFSLTSWADPESEPFPPGNRSCRGIVGEYFSDDMNKNKSFWSGLYIFCIWKNIYDGKYCTKAVIFHEIFHYVLDLVRKNLEYAQIKNEFSVKIPIAPNTNLDNFYSDEAVVEDCELKLFSCGPDYYKHQEENYYKNKARRFNPPNYDDCKLCDLCKQKK